MSAALVALFAPYCQGAARLGGLEPAQLELEVAMAAAAEPARYQFSLPTAQLVIWLMDWLEAGGQSGQPADLPESFWQWLLLGLDPHPGTP